MKLKLRKIVFDAGRPIAFIHEETAKKTDIHVGDRVEVSFSRKKVISTVDIVKGFVNENEISLSEDVLKYLGAKVGSEINVHQLSEPLSMEFISKKMKGKKLSKDEIYTIVKDVAENALTEAETAYFVLGVDEMGMTFNEVCYLTEAMCKTGKILVWPKGLKVADKHSIGGIPGNRTTPIVVSICVATGVTMPKTSSRAITSAAGTADTIETIAKVDFDIADLKEIVRKTGGCFVWGGSLGLAPADDKLIRIERILNLDPESQLIASIMSKKLAAGSRYILIDIPYGKGAKVTKRAAKKLKSKFIKIAKHFNVSLNVILTDGSQPIGNGFGPVLEMMDVLRVLKRDSPPKDLEMKSVILAGKILEMVGKAKPGKGRAMAQEILESGSALNKFNQITDAQGRKSGPLKLSKFSYLIKADKNGKIVEIDNKSINHLSRVLGCPTDKGSGIYLHKHLEEKIKKGEPLLTFYAESKKRITDAVKIYTLKKTVKIAKQ